MHDINKYSICRAGVTKRCRLSWRHRTVSVYEPKYGGGGGGGVCDVSANEYIQYVGAKINFGYLFCTGTPYSTYGYMELFIGEISSLECFLKCISCI
jgi:hypothetical protein